MFQKGSGIMSETTFKDFIYNYDFKEYDEKFTDNNGISYIVIEVPNNEKEESYFKIKFGIEDYCCNDYKLYCLDKLFNETILNMYIRKVCNKYNTTTITLTYGYIDND